MDIQILETWLRDKACAIRGPLEVPKFKDYILLLVFLKQLLDVFDDELARLSTQFGSEKTACSLRQALLQLSFKEPEEKL